MTLNLGDNSFSCSLPSSLGSLTSLEMLSLRGNKFSGELPLYLQNCTKLKFLDLSDNELSGEIPMWLGQRLPSLVFLSLQRNQFRGRIPHQLCELKYLQILDLSVNKISASIPPCLKNFNSMAKKVSLDRRIELHLLDQPYVRSLIDVRYVDEALITWKGTKQNYPQLGLLLAIDLSCNKLTGEISEELNSLQELVALNSQEIFYGKILQKIGHLRQLEKNSNQTQLLSFDPSSFSHNRGLCGPPVSPNCSMVEPPPQTRRRGKAFLVQKIKKKRTLHPLLNPTSTTKKESPMMRSRGVQVVAEKCQAYVATTGLEVAARSGG
ncbi:receptor-like protein EIX2 [Gossypium raimondii]|uniref:receptor-like protein EIX2 n=1 Tax=Gossypium raimondii TaxID=29730 RepID=UPI00227A772F|nr:receptor-like protein EIX2 [Gossypium raimondii]